MRQGEFLLRLWIAVAAVAALWISPGSAQSDADLQLFPQSVATVNDVTAGFINPAALAPEYVLGLRYLHAFPDSTLKGDDGFIIALRGFLFAAQWLRHSDGIFRRKYSLASGSRLFPNFYWGLAYNWFGAKDPTYRQKRIWKGGLLYRPRPNLSLAFVADDINRPKLGQHQLERAYTLGIGFRPIGEKLTISADGTWREKERLADGQAQLRLEILPHPAWSVAVAYTTDGTISAGLSYAIAQSQIGSSASSRRRNFTGGTFFYNQGPVVSTISHLGGKYVARLTIDASLTEEVRYKRLWGSKRRSLLEVLNGIDEAARDKQIAGLLVNIEEFPLGIAAAQELRAALVRFRSTGKKVVAYFENAGNLEYYIASAANEIYMAKSGVLEFCGLLAEFVYLKETLDKLGLQAQFVTIGEFKTFPNMVTSSEMPPAESLQSGVLLDDVFNQLITDIAHDRQYTQEELRRLIDNAPFTARQAIERKLVTDTILGYEINEEPKRFFGTDYEYRSLRTPINETRPSRYWGDPAHIAIIYATGEIVEGRSGYGILTGSVMGEKTIVKALRKARTDNRIKAVILRIDSPGGEFCASSVIADELERIKGKKPLIVSVGDVAASGGYLLACVGDDVLMMPGSITGSVGIFAGKLVAQGLYRKLGINKVILKRGEHADMRSDWRPLTQQEQELATQILTEFYGDLLDRVSRWRGLDRTKVDSLAQGRVWSGEKAVVHALGTCVGGFLDAIELAKRRAHVRKEQPVQFVILPEYGFEFSPFAHGDEQGLAAALKGKLPGSLLTLSSGKTGYLSRLPYLISIK